MTVESITIQVEPAAAEAYRALSEQDRRKIDLLLSLRLRDATRSERDLQELMRDISRKAKKRGLTPEILKSILDES
jgi:hypothetical protein